MADDHDATTEPEKPAGDARARFREALTRKQDAAHRSAEGRQNTGVVHGSEVTGAAKRTFRRKTG
ncbi:MAG TPA: DUF5302 domain-containing protein [Actinotalea sp.]|jgi:hypothetical protein